MSKTVVFITALSVEFLAVKGFIQNWKETEHDEGTIYQESSFKGWRIGLAKTGQGNANAAMETERAIQFFDPDYVFFVGVAGGIKDVKLGDVVIAETMKGYEKGKEVDNVFLPRSEVGKSNYKLVKRADAITDNSDWNQNLSTGIKPKALIGVIAAGEKVVASEHSRTYKQLIELYSDAIAVEMEGIGFLTAIHANSQVKGIVIRGISDLLSNKAESDNADWQPKAAHHAAAFAFAMLERLLPTSVDFNKNNNLQELQEILKPIAQNLSDKELKKFNSICQQYVYQECIQNSFLETLNYLFDLGWLSNGQYPILCVINHLIKENIIINLAAKKLIEWLQKYSDNLNVNLQTVKYISIKQSNENEPSYLTIQLKTDKDSLYIPQAWLNGINICPDDITNIELKNEDEKTLQPLMDRLLEKVICMENEPLIEFILPKELMYYHFDKLENKSYENNPIGICYQLVIQALDRREHKKYFPKWKKHWKNILQEKTLNQKVKDKLIWLKEEEHKYILASMTEIEPGDKKCCFGFNFKFSTCQKKFLDELIMWGAFAALWSCQYKDIDLEKDITNFLNTQIINLPESIYNFRCHHRDKEKYITLFWDNPDRLPPQLEPNFLGSEFR
ncbi:MAG: hypothetical protein NTY50_19280 [Methylobacter sp.]|nr:hypothetical protein [Methylobacter sp.]